MPEAGMTRLSLPWLAPDPAAPFPPVERALQHPNGLLAAGGDLSPKRLLAAYRHGIFPWYADGEPILWWSPDPRCVFHTDRMHVPRRLRRELRASTWRIEVDRRFPAVIDGCATARADGQGTWITSDMRAAYIRLHRLGHAHSVEAVDGERLVGGLYGVTVGSVFCAESMFSAETNGSKAALLGLAAHLLDHGMTLIDAQVPSPHLFTLGAEEMPRARYVALLEAAAQRPAPALLFAANATRPVAELVARWRP
jgi:leucyl/phenylalanyl-tRNA--protein transferase